MESSPEALRRIHHQARSALTSAELALHGLTRLGGEGREEARLGLVRKSLARLDELLTQMEAVLPPLEK